MVAAKKRLSRADYKRREGIHWNERGHRRVAALLGDLYEKFRSGTLDELMIQASDLPQSEYGGWPPAQQARPVVQKSLAL